VSDRAYFRGCMCGADLWLEVEMPDSRQPLPDYAFVMCPACNQQVGLEPNEDQP
jgi:hypothetical protein